MANRRILSGMRATNPRLHLGNYEGALRNWVEMQNDGFEMFCMVADWHGLTTMYEESAEISRNAREVAKDYIAAGIDPEKSALFIQSHVKEHAELHLLFSMITPLGWLERTPTFKEKVSDLLEPFRDKMMHFILRFGYAIEFINQNHEGRLEEFYKWAIDVNVHDVNESLHRISGLLHQATRLQEIFKIEDEQFKKSLADARGYFESSMTDSAPTVPYGLLGYPVLQTADILLYKPYGVPVGRDQAPHLEIGNDIAARFNRLYGVEVFQPYKYLIPEDENRAKVPGLDADENGVLRKMSKSYDNCIYLSATPDEIAEHIKKAFTTPTKLRKTDPGIPEGCAVCQYLKLYSPDWQRQWNEDRAGERGCMQSKKELTEILVEFLRPFRERRAQFDDGSIEEILSKGADKAREVAAATMSEVRAAMGIY